MNIAICEGKDLERETLCAILRQCGEEMGVECRITAYASGEALLNHLRKGKRLNYLILATDLPDMSGMALARVIREFWPGIAIAFLSDNRENAIDAFAMDALHYAIKPVNLFVAEELVKRYLEHVHRPVDQISIRIGEKRFRFPLRKVQKVLSAGRNTEVYLSERPTPITVPAPFSSIEAAFRAEAFLMVGRGALVNADHIADISASKCRMKDGSVLMISRTRSEEVRQQYVKYRFCFQDEREPD